MTKPQSLLSWIGSRLLLSFLSALAGWAAGMVLFTILTFVSGQQPLGSGGTIAGLLIIGLIMGIIVLAILFLALLPLSLLVSSKSFLWKPGILTLIGIFAGPIIICVYALTQFRGNDTTAIDQPRDFWMNLLFLAFPAAIVSGVTCYVGSRLKCSWDREFEADVKAGKLDALGKEADKDFEAGRCKPL